MSSNEMVPQVEYIKMVPDGSSHAFKSVELVTRTYILWAPVQLSPTISAESTRRWKIWNVVLKKASQPLIDVKCVNARSNGCAGLKVDAFLPRRRGAREHACNSSRPVKRDSM
jgi:hypothetical protein